GPVTRAVTMRPPVAATSAATVPSPPSAIGHSSTCASGAPRRTPAAIASATSAALRQPLNLSGAIRIRIGFKFEFHHGVTEDTENAGEDGGEYGRGWRIEEWRMAKKDAVAFHPPSSIFHSLFSTSRALRDSVVNQSFPTSSTSTFVRTCA